MTRCTVTILNPLGLHARAAAAVRPRGQRLRLPDSRRAGRPGSRRQEHHGAVLLAASQGSGITITADGPDEDAAVVALCALIERGLDEAPCA